jgi:uncharacterized protein (TIGR02246 family)
MRKRSAYLLAAALAAFLVAGVYTLRDAQQKAHAGDGQTGSAAPADRPGDREVIGKLGQDFREAFGRGDAKALAGLYTEQGEYYDDTTGEAFRGRGEIEMAYAKFFKEMPGRKIIINSRSLRFLGRDVALQEGLVGLEPTDSELPRSVRYSCLLVREDGHWKLALEREWGVEENKLEDLNWLIGTWSAQTKDRNVEVSFRWNDKKTLIVSKVTVQEAGNPPYTTTQRIGIDPESSQIRSWSVDPLGGRGRSVWVRDGNNWLLDSEGVLGNGTQTTSVNIISRLGPDAFTWRSVDRVIGSEELPPTNPIKVVRVKGKEPTP